MGVAIDNFKEGRHGARVVAEENNLFALLHVEGQFVEEHGAIVGHGLQVVHLQNLVARLAIHLEDNAGVLTRRRLNLFHVEFLEHLLAAGRLAALGHIGREAADKLFQLLLLLLGLLLLVLSLTQGQLRTLVPEGVVTREEGYLAEINIYGVRADLVEEVAVVAHDQHRVLEVAEVLLQPFHGFEVKVVGRLVEQEVVGLAKEGLRQHDAHLLLTAEFAHQFAVQFVLDAQAAQERGSIVLGSIATDVRKLILQFGHEDTILVGEILLGIEFVALLHDVPHDGVAHQYGIQHRTIIIFEVVLTEHRHTFAWSHLNSTLRRVKFTRDGAEQGGFASTISTDDTINITVRKLHVDVLIQDALTELDGQVGQCNHCSSYIY